VKALLLFLVLTGCTTDFRKDGQTQISYCLLGSVTYMDDSKAEHIGTHTGKLSQQDK